MHVNYCLLHLNGFAPTQCGGSRKLTLETVSIVFDRIWADIGLRMNDIFNFRKSILLKSDFTENKPVEMFYCYQVLLVKEKKTNMFYFYRYPKQRRDIMN